VISRRAFLGSLAGGLSRPARRQGAAGGEGVRIGMLDTTPAAVNVANVTAFRQGRRSSATSSAELRD